MGVGSAARLPHPSSILLHGSRSVFAPRIRLMHVSPRGAGDPVGLACAALAPAFLALLRRGKCSPQAHLKSTGWDLSVICLETLIHSSANGIRMCTKCLGWKATREDGLALTIVSADLPWLPPACLVHCRGLLYGVANVRRLLDRGRDLGRAEADEDGSNAKCMQPSWPLY